MDRNYIDDHNIVARYLADQLSDEERAAFEAYYLQHPEVVQEMEATARFKNGLFALQRKQALEPLLQTAARPPFNMRLAAALAAISITALLVTIAFNALETPTLGTTVAEVSSRFGTPLQTSATYDLIRVRGASIDQRVVLPAEPSALRFRVLPDDESSTYRVSLRRAQDDREIETLESVSPDTEELVTVYVNSAKLSPGLYELVLTPTTGTHGQALAFTIDVVP